MCQFAKNGGKAVFTITLYNAERPRLLADIRRIEQLIDIQMIQEDIVGKLRKNVINTRRGFASPGVIL